MGHWIAPLRPDGLDRKEWQTEHVIWSSQEELTSFGSPEYEILQKWDPQKAILSKQCCMEKRPAPLGMSRKLRNFHILFVSIRHRMKKLLRLEGCGIKTNSSNWELDMWRSSSWTTRHKIFCAPSFRRRRGDLIGVKVCFTLGWWPNANKAANETERAQASFLLQKLGLPFSVWQTFLRRKVQNDLLFEPTDLHQRAVIKP